jgi:hypothetical protein
MKQSNSKQASILSLTQNGLGHLNQRTAFKELSHTHGESGSKDSRSVDTDDMNQEPKKGSFKASEAIVNSCKKDPASKPDSLFKSSLTRIPEEREHLQLQKEEGHVQANPQQNQLCLRRERLCQLGRSTPTQRLQDQRGVEPERKP